MAPIQGSSARAQSDVMDLPVDTHYLIQNATEQLPADHWGVNFERRLTRIHFSMILI